MYEQKINLNYLTVPKTKYSENDKGTNNEEEMKNKKPGPP